MGNTYDKNMKYILLDKSIIKKYPILLGLKIPDIRFVVTQSLVSKIAKDKKKGIFSINQKLNDRFLNLIYTSHEFGFINLEQTNYEKLIDSTEEEMLINGWEILSSIQVMTDYVKRGLDLKVAVGDKEKYSVTTSDNSVYSEPEILELIAKYKDTLTENSYLSAIINHYQLLPYKILLTNLIVGLIVLLIGFLVTLNFNYITSEYDSRILTFLAACFGILLFLIRENLRLGYGLAELIVGVFTIHQTIIANEQLKFDWSYFLGILGGLYIMVRGQDNIVKHFKDTPIGLWLKDNLGVGS